MNAFFATLAALLIYRIETPLMHCQKVMADLTSHRLFRVMAILAFLAFYLTCYLSRPVYYESYHGGALGDDYNYAHHGLSERYYFIPHHLVFPFVPAQMIHGIMNRGLLDRQDPQWAERAFVLYSFPGRVFVLVGGLFFYLLMRRVRITRTHSLLGTAFLFTTFGYWYWALQTNVMSLLIPWTLVALWANVKALQERHWRHYAFAGFATAFCMYIHISSVYLTIGMGMSILFVSVLRAIENRQWRPLAGPVIYGLIAALMAWGFYRSACAYYHSTDLERLMSGLADYSVLGHFKADLQFLKRLVIGTFGSNKAIILGVLRASQGFTWERVIVILQYAILLLLAASFFTIRWRSWRDYESYAGLLVILSAFLCCIIGFALRVTWTQYYVALTGTTTALFIGLSFYPDRSSTHSPNALFVGILTFCLFLTNGFSTRNVFYGEKVESNVIYRQLQTLKTLASGQPIRFYGRTNSYDYNFDSITRYYRLSPHYEMIQWQPPAPLREIIQSLNESSPVIYLNQPDYPDAQMTVPQPYRLHAVQTPSSDYPVLWRLERSGKR